MGSVTIDIIPLENSTDVCEVVNIKLIDSTIKYTIAFGKIINYEEVRSSKHNK